MQVYTCETLTTEGGEPVPHPRKLFQASLQSLPPNPPYTPTYSPRNFLSRYTTLRFLESYVNGILQYLLWFWSSFFHSGTISLSLICIICINNSFLLLLSRFPLCVLAQFVYTLDELWGYFQLSTFLLGN